MAEELREAASTVGVLDALLLDAKLSVPPPRAGTVSRAGLVERARASGCRAVGVTAPAGYGKSTLLGGVGAGRGPSRRVAVIWIGSTMIPRRCSPCWRRRSLGFEPGNADLVADMGGLGVSLLGRAAPRLASAFRTSPVPFVLMLDDLHELRSPACHDVLGVVIVGDSQGLAAGGGESFRAASPAAAAGVG